MRRDEHNGDAHVNANYIPPPTLHRTQNFNTLVHQLTLLPIPIYSHRIQARHVTACVLRDEPYVSDVKVSASDPLTRDIYPCDNSQIMKYAFRFLLLVYV